MELHPSRAFLPRRRAAAAAALVALALVPAGCGGSGGATSTTTTTGSGQRFEGAEMPATKAPPFQLTDQQGHTVTLAGGHGRVTVLAFLFTGCRACTVIAQQVRGALDQLSAPARTLFVSVDPAADTPARVRAFLAAANLSGRVSYLTGPPGELAHTWSAYHVLTPAARGLAEFETAAPVLLIDGSGRERVLFEEEQLTPEALAHDIGVLQAQHGQPESG